MLSERQNELYVLMSDISEACWCAGWMSGNEFALWRMVVEPALSTNSYGQSSVPPSRIALMRRLAEEIEGWIYWHDDEDEPELPAEAWGPRYIRMDDWCRRYARVTGTPGRS